MNATITLREYIEKRKTIIIPEYQRGYIWGKKRTNSAEKDSVTYLLDDLLNKFKSNAMVFLQGVTVTEKDNKIVLIDGQQRTTCLFLLLKSLGFSGKFDIEYRIRQQSNDFLKNLTSQNVEENTKEEYQDIFFFKKTLRTIKTALEPISEEDRKRFIDFLLDNIYFLYINIPDEQATKVFSMMNGNRAEMLQEEVIKAEILRLISLNDATFDKMSDREKNAIEWDNNSLRSKYAREWDKWLRWWNQSEVKTLYNCNKYMGHLLSSFVGEKELRFEDVNKRFLRGNTINESKRNAKNTFDALRRLQKRFEDAFNDPTAHDMIGAILRIMNEDNCKKFFQYYFVDDKRNDLEKYYKLSFLDMTHDEIIENNQKQFADKYDTTLNAISDDLLYGGDYQEKAYKLLLRLNVDQDIKQKRKFNFQIWNERSLEHIYPKSKVIHQNEYGKWVNGNNEYCQESDEFLKRDQITTSMGENTTEHSIGNLVLLYKNENSKFNDSDFKLKKIMFFDPNRAELFKSRHLLHTICVFAEKMDWNGETIAQNKINIVNNFIEYYGKLKEEFQYGKQN